MAVIGDIEWYRGDSYPLELSLKNKSDGLPIDITGYTFVMTVDTKSSPPDDTTKVFSTPGVISGDPTLGKVTFTPSPANTSIAPAGYYYDIQMTDAGGNIRTIAKFKFKVVQDISK